MSLESPLHNDTLTEVGDFDRRTEGYIIIASLPEEAKQQIYAVQDSLAAVVPPSSLWLPRGEQLHITFAHVVSPDSTYERDRSELFADVQPEVEHALQHAAQQVRGDTVTFDQIKVFSGAIILEGIDDGTIAAARSRFADDVTLPEGTRTPPNIIHTTIARFREQLPLNDVRAALNNINPNITFQVTGLQLIQEHAMYTQSHTVLKEV